MPDRLQIRMVVFHTGERLPMLVQADTGLPLFDPCVYAMTVLRPASRSAATVEQALRGVQFLLSFTEAHGIDLASRLETGKLFELWELDALVRSAFLPLRNKATSSKSEAAAQVDPTTAAIRLHRAGAYLKWLGDRVAGQLADGAERQHAYALRLTEILAQLAVRTPALRSSQSRMSLSSTERETLLRVTAPDSLDNPWADPFVRDRNRLIILWGLGLGLRRGELAGLRISNVDFVANKAVILRRADDPDDPRARQPNAKTLGRELLLGEALAQATHDHIRNQRSRIKGARKHDFLLVSESGKPLSLSAITKLFQTLRTRWPQVGAGMSMHVLRHCWNEDFSDIADARKLDAEQERRARNHAMGWSERSRSADTYLRRRARRLAGEVSTAIQRRVMTGRPSDAG